MTTAGRRPSGRPRPAARVATIALVVTMLMAAAACSTSSRNAALHRATHTPMAPLDGGASVALASYVGRPLVVNEWASWCVPCRTEMPLLEATDRQLAGRATVVGVSSDTNRAGLVTAARRAGVTYPLLVDKDAAVQGDLGVVGLPTTLFFDAKGHLVATHTGQLSASALRTELHRVGLA